MGGQARNPASQEEQPLLFGTAPVNWNNFDLEGWRPIIPFPDILDEMVTAGYLATEWDESFGTDASALNRARDTRGMAYCGAYRWLDFVDNDAFERDLRTITPFLETLQGIGARELIVADSLRPDRVAVAGSVPEDGSHSLDADGYDRIAANLLRLSARVAGYGLRLHYHNHVGSYIETPMELENLVSRLDLTMVDLCFDTGHYAFGGGDCLEFVRSNPDSIGYVHLKDVDQEVLEEAAARKWSFLEALRNFIFCPLGTGSAQIPGIIDILIEKDFRDFVIVEQDTCRGNATETARSNLETVQGYAVDSIRNRRPDL